MVLKNLQDENAIHLAVYDGNKNGVPPEPLAREFPPEVWRDFSRNVAMPFSEANVVDVDGREVRLHEVIEEQLQLIANTNHLTVQDLAKSIGSYNYSRIDIRALEKLFNEMTHECANSYLQKVIPKMAELALAAKTLFKQPIPFLKANQNGSVTMSQQQCASLLANAFFCTFPDHLYPNDRLYEYNCFYFWRLFRRDIQNTVEKLKCLLYYFKQVTTSMPCGTVTFLRHETNATAQKFASSEQLLTEMKVDDTEKIEDQTGLAHVDFANEFIGGGVFEGGCVQEEIRFSICPEMLVSCLICERMRDNEAILIIGAERYSDYNGYGRTFRWKRKERVNSKDVQRDPFGHAYSELIAIDAVYFDNHRLNTQFDFECINREIIKAYAGFSIMTNQSFVGIATGNWGCGAFNGNPQLKSLLQLIAASEAGRPLHYYTFGSHEFSDQLMNVLKLLYEKNYTVGSLHKLITTYAQVKSNLSTPLFSFIERELGSKNAPASHDQQSSEVRTNSSNGEPAPKKMNTIQSTLTSWLKKEDNSES